MAEIKDWQRQNMKKGASCAAPLAHNGKIHPSGVVSNLHTKIAMPTHGLGGLVTSPVKGYADGGEVEDKAAGLEASKGDTVGFFDRLRMGSIDDPKSEAYDRFGAGMGRSVREAKAETDSGMYSTPKTVSEAKAALSLSDDEASDRSMMPMTKSDFQSTDKDTTRVARPDRRVATVAPSPASQTAGRSTYGRKAGEQAVTHRQYSDDGSFEAAIPNTPMKRSGFKSVSERMAEARARARREI